MPILEKFILHWKKNFSPLLPPDTSVLLAVSGGLDSVVMTDLFVQAKIPVTIAHVNFQLRGDESIRDEKFVEALGAFYQVPVLTKIVETQAFATEHKCSIQEAARTLRYQWFHELLSPAKGLALIATAHHANDSLETLLLNFFRGTGIAGLHGILPIQGKIIRPLLFARKEELTYYAIEKNLSWVEDSSNESDKYTRNYFRHQLLPSLEKIFPAVQDNLLENISRLREVEQLYQEAIKNYKKKLLKKAGTHWVLSILQLKKTNALPTILWEILQPFHFTAGQLPSIIQLLDAQNGALVLSDTHRIIKDRKLLLIAPITTTTTHLHLLPEGTKQVTTPFGDLQIEQINSPHFTLSQSPLIATIDVSKIVYPLKLRPWKTGDYFYPLGMQKKKKVARFLMDQKLSKIDKEKLLLLENGDQRIIWVIGKRIDDRFKITNHTKSILRIEWKEQQ